MFANHPGRIAMKRVFCRSTSFLLVLTFISVLVTGVESSFAAIAPAGPNVTSVLEPELAPGTIMITGEGFTPGGAVYVALYDPWGIALHETRWTTASQTIYGPRGSTDPALGYRQGGKLNEMFAGLCGATVLVRAFDHQTATWSNWMNVDSTTASSTVYAEVGRHDPALSRLPAC
jgi:hypothetical protein